MTFKTNTIGTAVFAEETPSELFQLLKQRKAIVITDLDGGDNRAYLNHHFGIDFQDKQIPDKTKLLMQQFLALLKLGVVLEDQLTVFLNAPDHRQTLKFHPDYRKTVYIGNDVNDYLAAKNAGFDFFIAITATGKCTEAQFIKAIQDDPSEMQIILADNLRQVRSLLERKVSRASNFMRHSVFAAPAAGDFEEETVDKGLHP